MPRFPRALPAVAALTVALSACNGGGAAPATTDASIQLFRFRPHTLTIDAGTTVAWHNEDEILHTVTGDGLDGRLDGTGTTYRHRFARTGTYSYHCTRHPGMDAEVVVR